MTTATRRIALSPGFVERANRAMIDGQAAIAEKRIDRPAAVNLILRSTRLDENQIREGFSEALKRAGSL
ncbi:hypothetical protein [uncultured Zoogloea sp.]|uniref:hypothetical protein n=1 Tax=uncultured Zoogloea sp. TaxID=160237 RepID=UPI002614468A|nr:hypothetical protein [uncultured Zoogloea sp.]